nr:MAG TPA_asm: hypothetical protein [Caudoviricetes sp.]
MVEAFEHLPAYLRLKKIPTSEKGDETICRHQQNRFLC